MAVLFFTGRTCSAVAPSLFFRDLMRSRKFSSYEVI